MTGADLIDRFVVALLRSHGGTKGRWRKVLGRPRVYSPATHPHCNWELVLDGTPAENAAIENLADRLRIEHPLIER